MPVRLSAHSPQPTIWKTIHICSDHSIDICLRHPTFEDQVASLSERTLIEQYRTRLARTITDWRGVVDDQVPPQPLAFTPERLQQLITTYPQTLFQIDRAIAEVWYVLPEDQRKNWPAPPSTGGNDLEPCPPNTTASLSSGIDSAIGSD